MSDDTNKNPTDTQTKGTGVPTLAMGTGAKFAFWTMIGIAVAAAVVLAVWLVTSAPKPLWPLDFDIARVLTMLMTLFVAALFVERAAEVIITVWREPGKADIEHWASVVRDQQKPGAPTRTMKAVTSKALKDLQPEAFSAALVEYKATTGRLAGVLTFTMGVAIACAGLRALNPLMDQTSLVGISGLQRGVFYWLDAVITGAMIGGGSAGIHQMMLAIIAAFEKVRKLLEKPPADSGGQ